MLMTLEKSQNFTYYAGIMLDAFAIPKLCWHKPIEWPWSAFQGVHLDLLPCKIMTDMLAPVMRSVPFGCYRPGILPRIRMMSI